MQKNKNKRIIIVVICMLVAIIGAGIYGLMRVNNSSAASKQQTRIIHTDQFSKIKIAVVKADVSLKYGTKYQVKIIDSKKNPLNAKVKGDELIVSEPTHKQNNFLYIGKIQINGKQIHPNCRVEITVPHKDSVKAVNGDVDTGDFELTGLSVKKLTISADTGDIALKQAVVANGDLEADTGDVKIWSSRLANTTGDVDTGDVNISNTQLLGSNSFSVDTGDFTLNDANKKMTYHLSADTGDINYFGVSEHDDFTKVLTTRKNILKVDSSTGNITIK